VIQSTGSRLAYRINQQQVSKLDLLPRLTSIFANRAERVMFVKGDDNVGFSQVAEVIDIGHAAGVENVGLMTPKILEGR
jgi:biopolymer transport protein ExbD